MNLPVPPPMHNEPHQYLRPQGWIGRWDFITHPSNGNLSVRTRGSCTPADTFLRRCCALSVHLPPDHQHLNTALKFWAVMVLTWSFIKEIRGLTVPQWCWSWVLVATVFLLLLVLRRVHYHPGIPVASGQHNSGLRVNMSFTLDLISFPWPAATNTSWAIPHLTARKWPNSTGRQLVNWLLILVSVVGLNPRHIKDPWGISGWPVKCNQCSIQCECCF